MISLYITMSRTSNWLITPNVAAPAFLEKHGEVNSLEKLESLPATIYAAPGLLFDKFGYQDEQGKQQHFQLNVAYKVNDVEMLARSAAGGNTLAVVSAQMVQDEIKQGTLVPIMTHLNIDDFGTFYAVYPHRDAPIKTKLFIGTLKSIVGEGFPIWEKNIPNFDKMYGRGK